MSSVHGPSCTHVGSGIVADIFDSIHVHCGSCGQRGCSDMDLAVDSILYESFLWVDFVECMVLHNHAQPAGITSRVSARSIRAQDCGMMLT